MSSSLSTPSPTTLTGAALALSAASSSFSSLTATTPNQNYYNQQQQQQQLTAAAVPMPTTTVITSNGSSSCIPAQQCSQRSLPPKTVTAIRLVHNRLRRQSYDVRVLNADGSCGPNAAGNNTMMMGNGTGSVPSSNSSHLRPYRTASARLNQSFTSPSLTSAPSVFSLSAAKRRCSRLISFGFASAGFYVHRGLDGDEEWLEEFEFEEECERPSTSQSQNEEGDDICYSDLPSTVEDNDIVLEQQQEQVANAGGGVVFADEQQQYATTNGGSGTNQQPNGPPPTQQQQQQYRSRPAQQPHYNKQKQQQQNGGANNNSINNSRRPSSQQSVALFLLDHRIVPVYCNRPQGIQADQFLQSLTERNLNSIKKFL